MKRTQKQNKALHMYCEHLAQELNNAGLDIRRTLKSDFEIPWSKETVKELIYKPILNAMYNKDSTTEMTTKEVDKVFHTINRYMAERHGLTVDFPSIDSLRMDQLTNKTPVNNERGRHAKDVRQVPDKVSPKKLASV